MELSRSEMKQAMLPAQRAPDPGSKIERFNASQLAGVIEHEVTKAGENGLDNLRLTMSTVDAAALAKFLRRGSILGA